MEFKLNPTPRTLEAQPADFSGPAEWSLRDEIFAATQRWYWIVAYGLLGALIGWLVVQAWPSPHRVSKELFVGLNVYQSGDDRSAAAHAGLPIVNANDYKNWQMASLNVIVYTDAVLDDTLTRLRLLDPYWNDVDRETLGGMLDAYWRNAGKWRLVAEHPIPMYATQAVLLWQDAVIEQVHLSVAAAQNALQYDTMLQAVAAEQVLAVDRLAALNQVQARLEEWRGALQAQPADLLLGDLQRLQLLQAVTPLGASASWPQVENSFPPAGSPVDAYRAWVEAMLPVVAYEQAAAHARYQAHAEKYAELSRLYSQSASDSLGLSAELLVQQVNNRRVQETQVRPDGEVILIGAALGLIAWLLQWLLRPALAGLRGGRARPA